MFLPRRRLPHSRRSLCTPRAVCADPPLPPPLPPLPSCCRSPQFSVKLSTEDKRMTFKVKGSVKFSKVRRRRPGKPST